MADVTQCESCDYRHAISENRPPWRWLCSRFPRLPWADDIDKDGKWTGFDPYMTCVGINGGLCPLYEPRREA